MSSTKNNWKKLKKQIRERFDKLSYSDIDSLNGSMDSLPAKIQKVYEFDKRRAEKECKTFRDNLKI